MAIKDTLIELREYHGLTQTEMAERLFVTRQTVSRWECGDTQPSIDVLKLIATTFNVPVEKLLDMPRAVPKLRMPLGREPAGQWKRDGSQRASLQVVLQGRFHLGEVFMEDMVEHLRVHHDRTGGALHRGRSARLHGIAAAHARTLEGHREQLTSL